MNSWTHRYRPLPSYDKTKGRRNGSEVKKTKKKQLNLPAWDDTTHDLSSMKLTTEELERRKLLLQSKNHIYASRVPRRADDCSSSQSVEDTDDEAVTASDISESESQGQGEDPGDLADPPGEIDLRDVDCQAVLQSLVLAATGPKATSSEACVHRTGHLLDGAQQSDEDDQNQCSQRDRTDRNTPQVVCPSGSCTSTLQPEEAYQARKSAQLATLIPENSTHVCEVTREEHEATRHKVAELKDKLVEVTKNYDLLRIAFERHQDHTTSVITRLQSQLQVLLAQRVDQLVGMKDTTGKMERTSAPEDHQPLLGTSGAMYGLSQAAAFAQPAASLHLEGIKARAPLPTNHSGPNAVPKLHNAITVNPEETVLPSFPGIRPSRSVGPGVFRDIGNQLSSMTTMSPSLKESIQVSTKGQASGLRPPTEQQAQLGAYVCSSQPGSPGASTSFDPLTLGLHPIEYPRITAPATLLNSVQLEHPSKADVLSEYHPRLLPEQVKDSLSYRAHSKASQQLNGHARSRYR